MSHTTVSPSRIAFRGRPCRFVLDDETGALTRQDGQKVDLLPKEWELLRYLAHNPDKLISKDELIGAVWKGIANDATLSQVIRGVRRALGDNADAPNFVETVPSRGFRFVATIESDNELDLITEPLHQADTHLLQVLVHDIELARRGSGVHLRLNFTRHSRAIRRRDDRAKVRRHISDERKRVYQQKIDAVFEGEAGRVFRSSDPDFPFRHANGGVLPIVNLANESYYCLFYRETDPIGWNIANGGSDNSDELIDPQQIFLRELREEHALSDAYFELYGKS